MNTDKAWQQWGEKDPYFGVFTDTKYRKENLTEEAKQDFFNSGDQYIQQVLITIKEKLYPNFSPNSALDFGCGTGRLLLPLAKICNRVVGLDISDAMLQESQKNLSAYPHVSLYKSDDQFSKLKGQHFDFVNSFIVLQHIPKQRVLNILEHLIQSVSIDGVGVIHLTYAKTKFRDNLGIPPDSMFYQLKNALINGKKRMMAFFNSKQEPEMQMNLHSLNQAFFLLQNFGIKNMYTEFTNHDGALGITLYFRK
jgi:SAM-dependent methyltransferase